MDTLLQRAVARATALAEGPATAAADMPREPNPATVRMLKAVGYENLSEKRLIQLALKWEDENTYQTDDEECDGEVGAAGDVGEPAEREPADARTEDACVDSDPGSDAMIVGITVARGKGKKGKGKGKDKQQSKGQGQWQRRSSKHVRKTSAPPWAANRWHGWTADAWTDEGWDESGDSSWAADSSWGTSSWSQTSQAS
jgi:hypothetical protein